MRNGLRTDLIIFSLVVSALVHVGCMIYAQPKVMTHVVRGVPRAAKHGPMRVTEVTERPDPVRLDTVLDAKPDKDAPIADEITVAMPLQEKALLADAESVLTVPAVEMPEASAMEIPIDQLPEILSAPLSPIAAPDLRMFSETAAPVKVEDVMRMPTITDDLPIAPPVAMPTFEPISVTKPGEGDSLESKVMAPDEKKPDDFIPPPEVTDAIDESLVEAEKDAIRSLVDSVDAADLTSAVDVKLSQTFDANGSFFRVIVTPKPKLPIVPKDVVVLIDASGSIGRDRMASIRYAAKRILRSAANTGDRFNLVAFRDRFSYAFKTWQECNVQSFEKADRWLGTVAPFGRTDVFATISSVLTLPRHPSRPIIALVVTDGDANSGVSDTASILSKFSRLNDGLVSVYMYGVKSSANRELIEVLTQGNRGESFIFEESGWGSSHRAGSGIEPLSRRFRDPVLSDLRLVFASDCQAEVYPRLLKNLYRGESVEFYGRVPPGAREVAFSLKGLNGKVAYEGFYRLPLVSAAFEPDINRRWAAARQIDLKLR